jgi:hypothetical protein
MVPGAAFVMPVIVILNGQWNRRVFGRAVMENTRERFTQVGQLSIFSMILSAH